MKKVFLKSRIPSKSYFTKVKKVVTVKEARSIHNSEYEELKRLSTSVEMQMLVQKAYALGRLHYSELKS